MKEILRIQHGMQDDYPEEALLDYNLELYEGDILYIQGDRGSGLRTLAGVFAGDVALKGGSLYIWDQRTEDYSRNTALGYRICTVAQETDMVMHMSVADNLEAVVPVGFPLKLYQKKQKREKVQNYLDERQVGIFADDYVFRLSSLQRKKLSIIKAQMHGAKLIGLDIHGNYYEGREAEEICELIRRVNREGVSFVIFSESYSMFAETANRIQIISGGREQKEWYYHEKNRSHVKRILYHDICDIKSGGSMVGKDGFLGLFDYEWERNGDLWNYLRAIQKNNPELWERYINVKLPAKEEYSGREAVLIPMECAEMLPENLSLADNLILSIPKRVSGSTYGLIKKNVRENIAQRFYQRFGIDASVNRIQELDWVYRKILAVYRWELAKPKAIFLENPCNGLDSDKEKVMLDYLLEIKKKGILIIFLSGSMENLREVCSKILMTKNGKSAKITTI